MNITMQLTNLLVIQLTISLLHIQAVSVISLYSSPVNGWININFDSQEHSLKQISELKLKDLDWYGVDSKGEFTNNCPDFKFTDFRIINFEDWVEQFQNNEIIKIKTLTSKVIKHDPEINGDEEINRIFFDYLNLIMENQRISNLRIKKISPLRTGVQILDSEHLLFKEF